MLRFGSVFGRVVAVLVGAAQQLVAFVGLIGAQTVRSPLQGVRQPVVDFSCALLGLGRSQVAPSGQIGRSLSRVNSSGERLSVGGGAALMKLPYPRLCFGGSGLRPPGSLLRAVVHLVPLHHVSVTAHLGQR